MNKLILSQNENPLVVVSKIREIPGVKIAFVSKAGAVVFYPKEKLNEVSSGYFESFPEIIKRGDESCI